MENTCKHSRIKEVEVVKNTTGFVTNTQIVTFVCLDCVTNGSPTIIHKEIVSGRLTGHLYRERECANDYIYDEINELFSSS